MAYFPLWTSLHLGNQGRHGSTDVYEQWANKFCDAECVKNPPKTQGIIELHQKSAKHITINSKRERLDNVVSNFYLSKKSKLRQLEICKSRKKVCVPDENKIKDSLPSKIVTGKWRKRKQHEGPGYLKKNRKIDSDKPTF